MEKLRCYFVIDMKSFFASVECAERGLDPMTTNLVVADAERTDKTICLAVSPAMKALGVKNRCRLFEVPKDIDYIIARPRMSKYIQYAANIYGIYLKYIDKSDIHVYSIDECIIDATDYLKIYRIKAKDFAKKLINEINNTLHIPATAGIGTNMYLAKIALDLTAKHTPDKIGWLDEEKFKKTLWKHQPLTDFWGISRGISTRLGRFGIYDMESLAHCEEELLYKEFGVNAELLIDHSWGRESCLMEDIKNYKNKSKSISSSQILPNSFPYEDARIALQEMIQDGCYKLSKNHLSTSHINLIINYDRNTMVKGMKRLPYTTNLYSFIEPVAIQLFDEIVDKNKKILRIGYCFSELLSEDCEQYDLFVNEEEISKEKRVTKSVLEIKDKFGKNSILKGMDYLPNATQRDRNQQIGGHRSGESEDAED